MASARISTLDYEDYYDDLEGAGDTVPLTDEWESNDWLERSYVPCPRCKGTGMDRDEQDECQYCFGEGQILQDLPIPESIGHRFQRSIYSTTT